MASATAITGYGTLKRSSISWVDCLVHLIVEVTIEIRSETTGRVDMIHIRIIEAGGALGDAFTLSRGAGGWRCRRRAQQERNKRCELQHVACQ